MITTIDLGIKNVLGLKIAGYLGQEEYARVMRELFEEIKMPGHFNLYMELTDFEGFNPSIIIGGFQFAFQHIGDYLEKVNKIAFVSDKKWMRTFANAEYKLVPQIELKSFAFEDRNQAVDWIKRERI